MTAKANYSNPRRPVLHRQEQREAKKISRDNSKMDLNGYHLKRDFNTIVRNKDEEILKQIEKIQQLNQHNEVNI